MTVRTTASGIALAAALSFAGAGGASDTLSLFEQPPGSSPELSLRSESAVHPWRTAIFGGLIAGSYGAAYGLVFYKGWWGEQGRDFHFENDFDYALNLDKWGHAFSGQLMGEFFYDGLRWSGFSHTAARGWGAAGAFLTHVAIDIKDGFAPSWGFSVWDVMAGTAGGLWPWMQELWHPLDAVDLKASYFPHSDVYWEKTGESSRVFTDDYVNWTFWLSWKAARALPKSVGKVWPDWLALAVGFSIDDAGVLGKKNGRQELYLALDYDLVSLFRPVSPLAQRVVRWFNLFKWPAPALRISPSDRVDFFLLCPVVF